MSQFTRATDRNTGWSGHCSRTERWAAESAAGSFGLAMDGQSNGGDPADTEFPARFEIDYVRVYQQP